MRSGEELVPMSEDQLRRIFSEGLPNWLEEHIMTEVDAARVVAMLDTQAFFELLELPYPSKQAGVIDRLVQERLIDPVSAHFAIRRLGALLLAKKLADFPDISRKAPRVIVYAGISKTATRLDMLGTERGYAAGFRELVHFIMSQLPQNEVIEDALRKDVKLVPEITIRELVANALIHQDFLITGASVMIEIYTDRVEISNPGDPVVPLDRLIDGYQSRNERLADLMRRFSICEEKGSGVDKVVQAAEAHQLPAPDFRAGFKRFSVVLSAPLPFESMERNDRIRASYQHCCLCYVLSRKMTNQSLRERFRLPEAKAESISRAIRDAIDDGKVRLADPQQTSLRYRSYVPFWV
jgi:predicted HTH transcriptional regulator